MVYSLTFASGYVRLVCSLAFTLRYVRQGDGAVATRPLFLRYYHRVNTLPRVSFRLGSLEIRGARSDGSPRFQQKRVDILLAVDLVMHSAKGHIIRAALAAGDSDFVPAIAAAKNEGVAVTRYHGQSCHNDLRLAADESFRIDQSLTDSVRL